MDRREVPIELVMRENCENDDTANLGSRRASVSLTEIEELLRPVNLLPTLGSRPEDEILGYGDDGLPC
jgi:hypothetical protein